jgi:hypothetical protein
MTGFRASSFVLMMISLVFGYALCELVLFYYYAGSRGDDLEISLVPAFSSSHVYTRKPNQVAMVVDKVNRVNNAGFRRLEPTSETPPPDIVRVLSYGDSIGHGFGVEDGEQYTDQLETLLNIPAAKLPMGSAEHLSRKFARDLFLSYPGRSAALPS